MRISGSPMADVFVDLWGVLADSRRMTPAYRQRAAELLWSRHGGSIEAWLRAHDAAGAWYEAHMASPETWTEGTWIEVVNGAERENAGKVEAPYWRAIVDRLPTDPKKSFVVDDRPEYLKAAALVGFRCLLLDRDGRHPPATMPPYVEATLRNLAGLPQYVQDAVRAARVRA